MTAKFLIILFALIGITACQRNNDCIQEDSEIIHFAQIEDTTYLVSQGDSTRRVRVFQPKGKMRGTILLLPGWNYPIEHWSDSTKIIELAQKERYNLVMPDMGKSIYSRYIYSETRSDWKGEATRIWLNDTLIPYIQNQTGLLLTGDPNFILGISTGGRGAVLVGFEQKGRFRSIAALSGDFDQSKYPEDNLYKGFFGMKDEFPERYSGKENPVALISEGIPVLFLLHGKNDQVVPPEHSLHFYEKLKNDGRHRLELVPEQGHNYTFWNNQMKSVFQFFNSFTSDSLSLD